MRASYKADEMSHLGESIGQGSHRNTLCKEQRRLMKGCEGTNPTSVTTIYAAVNFLLDLMSRQINDTLRNVYKPINKTVLL